MNDSASLDKSLPKLVLAIVILYTALFGSLNVLRYRHFLSFEWEDAAVHHQVMWNTAHLRPFRQTIFPQAYEAHLRPIVLPIALLYSLVPRAETMYFLYCFFVATGGIAIYLWALKVFGSRRNAILASLIYFLYPPIHFLCIASLDTVILTIPLIAWAFYFLEIRKFSGYAACLGLALMCKENVGFTVAFIGVYAAIRRRGVVWWLGPIVAGIAWALIALKIIVPGLVGPESFTPMWFFRIRETFGDWLRVPFSVAWRQLTLPGKPGLFFKCLLPLLFLPIFSPATLVAAIPAVGQVVLGFMEFVPNTVHWIAPALPIAVLAALKGAGAAGGLLAKKAGIPRVRAVGILLWLLVISCTIANIAPNTLGTFIVEIAFQRDRARASNVFSPAFHEPDEGDDIAWKFIEMIPDGAKVAATGHLLMPLASRNIIHTFPSKNPDADYTTFDFILIDSRIKLAGAGYYHVPAFDRAMLLSDLRNIPMPNETQNAIFLEALATDLLNTGLFTLKARQGPCWLLQRSSASPF